MLESLLADLAASGWTISWAFQFAPNHWRVSIIHQTQVGEPQGSYISHCADAPTFAEALEDAILRRNDAEFVEDQQSIHTLEPTKSLIDALGLKPKPPTTPFPRRI